ncbi:MAG TPA: LptF/LptG family permease [Candidatus Cloacimonadota bacterium]|nr:LptF/LptG family permease [Candidatus Cloacimonadota bacterium]
MTRTLDRYVLKEHIAPFFISLMVVTFVLLLDQIMDLLNVIIEKHLDIFTILNVFGLTVPFLLALSIPMAVLIATIMAFGRLQVDSEIIAMKSAGINVYRLITPLVLIGILLSAFMIYFNNSILPETNHRLKNLMIRIAYYKPMTIIKPGEFNSVTDYTIYVKENNGIVMKGIIIYDTGSSHYPKTITAKRGNIVQLSSGNAMRAILYDGEMMSRDDKNPDKFEIRSFKKLILNIKDLGNSIDFSESSFRSDREMGAKQLRTEIQDKQNEMALLKRENYRLERKRVFFGADPNNEEYKMEARKADVMLTMNKNRLADLEDSIRSFKVELNKKYSIAFACIIFILIGIPLGLMTKSSGIGMAFSVSSFIFLIYYVSLVGGEQMADKGIMSPFIAMWISNIVFLIVAGLLISASIREKNLFDFPKLKDKLAKLLKI